MYHTPRKIRRLHVCLCARCVYISIATCDKQCSFLVLRAELFEPAVVCPPRTQKCRPILESVNRVRCRRLQVALKVAGSIPAVTAFHMSIYRSPGVSSVCFSWSPADIGYVRFKGPWCIPWTEHYWYVPQVIAVSLIMT